MGQWIDFKKLREELNFETVLSNYDIAPHIRDTEKGRQHSGPCPLSKCKGRPAKKVFSANLDEKIWQCFCCRQKGNILDFIGLMEGLDVSNGKDLRKAAEIAIQKFIKSKPATTPPAPNELPSIAEEARSEALVNAPLDFTLRSLDPHHPWFASMGLAKETVERFGLGFCSKGFLKGRIAIPLHDNDGRLIGYAGRLLDENEAADDNPLYLFPKTRTHKEIIYEFRRSEFTYNFHRIDRSSRRFAIVIHIEDVWWLWQRGYTNAVSLV